MDSSFAALIDEWYTIGVLAFQKYHTGMCLPVLSPPFTNKPLVLGGTGSFRGALAESFQGPVHVLALQELLQDLFVV